MCANWVKGYNVPLLISRLSRMRVLEAGDVHLRSDSFTDFSELDSILMNAVRVDEQICAADKRHIIRSAIKTKTGRKEVSADEFIAEAAGQESAFLRRAVTPYVAVTTCSVKTAERTTRIANSSIQIGRTLSKRFQVARESKTREVSGSLHAPMPEKYTTVRITTEGRSHYEAMERALDNVDTLRGMWNFALNRTAMGRYSAGRRKPVNRLVRGPFHTLHKLDGTLAEDSAWYEPTYVGPVDLYDMTKNERLRTIETALRKHLASSNYRTWLEAGLRLYVRALDDFDWHTSFLRLWGVLEYMTRSGRQTYETTVRRACFVTRDHEYHRLILEHLRTERNHLAHLGKEADDREAHLYQLKFYVDGLIAFHLGKSKQFDTPEEAADILDLPPDSSKLKRRVRATLIALEYRDPPKRRRTPRARRQ